jgi:hypothetical protein
MAGSADASVLAKPFEFYRTERPVANFDPQLILEAASAALGPAALACLACCRFASAHASAPGRPID